MITLYFALRQLTPPDAVSAAAPATEFSSERAMTHLRAISSKPHPVGSIEHAAVRKYIIDELQRLDWNPQTQTATVISDSPDALVTTATVTNVVARLKGAEAAGALMLAGHYDSVPTSPGAGDDGSAVAAMLETARALKAGPALKRDVILLFTDAEEIGLLGAKAFVEEHEWAKDVRLVLNFEASGGSGPGIMFETSDQNAGLIEEFAETAQMPVANSLSEEIYKYLPKDTDFNIFKKAGYAGLNFAFIDRPMHYHNPLDNIEGFDERSLQHQGANALSLARHFAGLDSIESRRGSSVYFSALSFMLFRYSGVWIYVFPLLAAALLIVVFITSLRRNWITLPRAAAGLGACVLCVVAVWFATVALSRIALPSQPPSPMDLEAQSYNTRGLYIIGVLAIVVALTSSIFIWVAGKIRLQNLAMGAMLFLGALMILSTLLLTGASYLFTWPLLFSLAGLYFFFASGQSGDALPRRLLIPLICAIPGIILFSQIAYLIFDAMGETSAVILAVIVALILSLLAPMLHILAPQRKWLLPAVAAVLGIGLLVMANVTGRFDREYPRRDNVFYVLNADTDKAAWVSTDQKPDEWTSQFLSENPERGAITDYAPSAYEGYLKQPAQSLKLAAADITVVEDSANNALRNLRLRVTSPRQSPVVTLLVSSDKPVRQALINGKAVNRDLSKQWGIQCFAIPKEGVELTLQTEQASNVRVRTVDTAYGLPEAPGQTLRSRPDNLIPALYPFTDSSIVNKTFVFDSTGKQ
jgi:peptidase M28-like protein